MTAALSPLGTLCGHAVLPPAVCDAVAGYAALVAARRRTGAGEPRLARLETGLSPRQLGLVRGVANGDWYGCVEAVVLAHGEAAGMTRRTRRRLAELATALTLLAVPR